MSVLKHENNKEIIIIIVVWIDMGITTNISVLFSMKITP